MKDSSLIKHWDSARELVGREAPTTDDVLTTRAGEPLESEAAVREFLATLDRARTA